MHKTREVPEYMIPVVVLSLRQTLDAFTAKTKNRPLNRDETLRRAMTNMALSCLEAPEQGASDDIMDFRAPRP
jgi:hypothetical protein